MTSPTISFVNEFQMEENTKSELNNLLTICFPEFNYEGRTFFKQIPHYRLLMKLNNKLIGQLAIDYRAMNLNQTLVTVFGVIDLVIHPSFQKNGLGTKLMKELERIAIENSNNIDFIFLVTDQPLFYERLGYTKTIQKVTWLKINQGKNYGIGNKQINDCFLMYKKVGNKEWSDGELDLLGYWY